MGWLSFFVYNRRGFPLPDIIVQDTKLRLLINKSSMPSAHVDIDHIFSLLTLEEKVSLTSAEDWWRTPIIRRGGRILVPRIKVCCLSQHSSSETKGLILDNRWAERRSRRELCQRNQICLLPMLNLHRCNVRHWNSFPCRERNCTRSQDEISRCSTSADGQCNSFSSWSDPVFLINESY